MKAVRSLAFTLVELIIVVFILGVLVLTAFVSLKDYPGDSRDALRKTDIRMIQDALIINSIETNKYPLPDNQIFPSSETGYIEGYFGEGAFLEIKDIARIPKDPTTQEYYKYYLKKDGTNFKLETTLEDGSKYYAGNYNIVSLTGGLEKSE